MLNFEFWNPTRVLFGTDYLQRLPDLLRTDNAKTVLIVYGGGSALKSGLLQKVLDNLSDFRTVMFSGVEANPEYTTLMKAVELARSEKVDFIIALGGGSVIDGVKFISGAIHYHGDPWEVLAKKNNEAFSQAVPFGTVLTLPATGSEVNSGAVINRSELKEKRTMGGPQFFPKFSICDPSVVATIPERQLANGIVDAYMHTLEQYLTTSYGNLLQEREAEAILSTLIEISDVVRNPSDYKLAYNFMLCASHALNGSLRCGAVTDWATHMIGHELTALYGIDHARTLAIIGPRLYEVQFDLKKDKLEQYGRRVFGIEGSKDEVARLAIERTESFFQSLGIETHLSAYTDSQEDLIPHVNAKFTERGWTEMGQNGSLKMAEVEEILLNCR
jgi:NADP-dependent alcohol dehydrogenase